MILVDTSIWVEHLRRSSRLLSDLLGGEGILSHPFVVGELALGGAARAVIDDLKVLPQSMIATDDEVLEFIDRHHLAGHRIGYVDAHLLVSTRLTGNAQIWTFDKSLRAAAQALGITRALRTDLRASRTVRRRRRGRYRLSGPSPTAVWRARRRAAPFSPGKNQPASTRRLREGEHALNGARRRATGRTAS